MIITLNINIHILEPRKSALYKISCVKTLPCGISSLCYTTKDSFKESTSFLGKTKSRTW